VITPAAANHLSFSIALPWTNAPAVVCSARRAAVEAATRPPDRMNQPIDTADDDFVDNYTPALLAQASQLISGEFHVIVQANGFTISDWRVLSTLSGGKPISIGELAQVSVTKQPTVTRLLDRMEAQGYVKRIPHETDRRITLVRITPRGQKLTSTLIAQARAHEDHVLAPLGKKKADELRATLKLLIHLHRPAN